MKAFRIQNCIVAAADEQAAITCWAEHFNELRTAAGPVEEIDVATAPAISIEEEDGSFRDGQLSEVMPADGPAQVVCVGSCDCD